MAAGTAAVAPALALVANKDMGNDRDARRKFELCVDESCLLECPPTDSPVPCRSSLRTTLRPWCVLIRLRSSADSFLSLLALRMWRTGVVWTPAKNGKASTRCTASGSIPAPHLCAVGALPALFISARHEEFTLLGERAVV